MDIVQNVKLAIENWSRSEMQDEWYFTSFREGLINNMDEQEAYVGIDEIIPLLLDVKNDYVFSEVIEIMMELVRKSNTTEIPPRLRSNWRLISNTAKTHGGYAVSRFDELEQFYRI
jgi:predicted nucleic acid-binding protein